MIDPESNDWISASPEPFSRSAGEFRGFPNAAGLHPLNRHTAAGTSRVAHESPERVTILVESGNRLWRGRYDFESFKAAMARGRVFITGGPIIDLTVNGKRAGETVTLPAGGGTVVIRAELSSPRALRELHLVHKSTPCSRASFDTRWPGMKLQS